MIALKPASVLPIHDPDDRTRFAGWLISPGGVHRDSEVIDRSNHAVIVARLIEADPDERDHAVAHFGHWAVGWIDEVLVRPGTACERIAIKAMESLDLYPILDEMHCSQMECDEECERDPDDDDSADE